MMGGLCPCLRALNSEVKIMEVKIIGQMDNTIDHTFESANRVYDKNGLCPTIPTCTGGNIQPKGDIALAIPSLLPGGSYKYIVAMRGRNPESPTDRTTGLPTEQRLELNSQGVVNSLTTVQKDNLVMESPNYRIRKLTPKECWRLMGFSDEDFGKAEKVCSATQLYKQAGNSIVVNVLMAIFSQMNIKGVKPWNEVHNGRNWGG